jgi:Domain of unknown function (DUF4157)
MQGAAKPATKQSADSDTTRIAGHVAPSVPRSIWHGLHRSLGNRGVQRWLCSGAIQAKLAVSPPDDVYEQEADRVADQVMRMPEPAQFRAEAGETSLAPRIQRLRPACEEKLQRQMPLEEEEPLVQTKRGNTGEKLQRQMPPEEEEPLAQAKRDDTGLEQAAADIEPYVGSLAGRGALLASAARAFMEPRFGADFSAVRVHTGAEADRSAERVRARAYTIGLHIVFRAGQYDPDSRQGKHLLAHELAHVVQQGGADSRRTEVQRQPPSGISLTAETVPAPPLLARPAFRPGPAESRIKLATVQNAGANPAIQRAAETAVAEPAAAEPALAEPALAEAVVAEPAAAEPAAAEPAATEPAAAEAAAAEPAVAVEKAPASPEGDPGYQTVVKKFRAIAKHERTPPKKPKQKSREVKDAAELSPETLGKKSGYDRHLQVMESAPLPKLEDFTVAGFTDRFRSKIDEIASKLPKEKTEHGSVASVVAFAMEKAEAVQDVKTQNQKLSARLREEAEKNPWDLKGQLPAAAPELKVDPAGNAPEITNAGAAAVKPKTRDEISLDAESRALDDALRNHKIGGQQISIDEGSLAYPVSGEKDFDEAGEAKRKAQEEIGKIFPRYRAQEKGVIAKSEAETTSIVKSGLKQHHQIRSDRFADVLGKQKHHEGHIEARKAAVFAQFQDEYKEANCQVRKSWQR